MAEHEADRFLIVDDQADDAELAMQALQDGYPTCRVQVARSAEEGLARAAELGWELILLDNKLPRRSGLEVLPEFRRLAPDAGIIMLTGHGDERTAVLAMRAGADYYLPKSRNFLVELPLVVREVREKRQLRFSLAHTEDRYRCLVENLTDIVYELDEEGRFRFVSSAVTDVLGYAPQEMVGIHFSHFIHPGDLPCCGRRFHERRTGSRATRRLEVRLAAKNGEYRECEVNAAGIYDSRRQFHATAGTARDVTERKHAAGLLRATETRLQAILEAAPDAIFLKDRQGRYLLVNPVALEFLHRAPRAGGSSEMVIGLTDADLFDARTAEEIARSDGHLFEQGDQVRDRIRRDTPEGVRTWDVVKVPYRDDNGVIQGLIGVGREVTEVLRMEDRARHAEKLRAIGEFVAGVAHELNNPLTGTLGYIELVRREVQDPRVSDRLDIARTQALRAAAIVQDLLVFARPASPQRTPVPVRELITHVLRMEEAALAASGVTVERDLAEPLKPVWGDVRQLERVLINLIGNAREAMEAVAASPAGAPADYRPRLRVSARTCCDGHRQGPLPASPAGEGGTRPFCHGAERIEIEIADNGPGIPAANRDKVFTPFFTTKPVGKGTGLGLAMVHALIQEHEGSIAVREAPTGGASFVIKLPVAPSPGAERDPGRPQAGEARGASPAVFPVAPTSSPRLHVVVIEDEPAIRDLMTTILDEEGYAVTTYADGEAAMAALLVPGAGLPDLVFLDVRMPGMLGTELFARLVVFDPRFAQRIIFCTGDVLSPETRGLIDQGVSLAIAKPFTRQKVKDAIAEARRARGMTRGLS